jgi:hypothetical protein
MFLSVLAEDPTLKGEITDFLQKIKEQEKGE